MNQTPQEAPQETTTTRIFDPKLSKHQNSYPLELIISDIEKETLTRS